jgi:Protein of unknown function (DUF1579)
MLKAINFSLTILIVVLFFTHAVPLVSQESQSPPPEIQKLYSFEGKWTGSYNVNMEGNKMNANATYTWSKITDGWGMFIDEKIEMPGMPVYLGHNTIGYDMGEKKYHLYTISNYAQVHDHVGNWTDDNTMYLEYNGTVEGKPFKEKIYMTANSPDECTLEVTEFTDGKATGSFKGTFKKNK